MPSIMELTRQVELVNKSFDDICNSGKNLTIRLQKVFPETLQNDNHVAASGGEINGGIIKNNNGKSNNGGIKKDQNNK